MSLLGFHPLHGYYPLNGCCPLNGYCSLKGFYRDGCRRGYRRDGLCDCCPHSLSKLVQNPSETEQLKINTNYRFNLTLFNLFDWVTICNDLVCINYETRPCPRSGLFQGGIYELGEAPTRSISSISLSLSIDAFYLK